MPRPENLKKPLETPARRLQTLDENGDGEISGDEVVIFAKNFAAQQVTLAEEHARAEAAEAESKQLRTRLGYAFGAILAMSALLTRAAAQAGAGGDLARRDAGRRCATAVQLLGTNRVVKKFHYTETRGTTLTNDQGETLECASADFAVGVAGGNATALVARDGTPLATKSARPCRWSRGVVNCPWGTRETATSKFVA